MGVGKACSAIEVCRLLLCAPADRRPNRQGDGQRMMTGLVARQELYYRKNGCFFLTGRLICN